MVETMPSYALFAPSDDFSMRTVGLLFAIGFGVMTPSWARAFSEDGFHDGMTVEEVQQQVQKQGDALSHHFEDRGFTTYFSKQTEGMNFDFCKEHLIGYRRPLANLMAAVKVITDNIRDTGQGQYEASMAETRGKASSFMRFMWNVKDGFTGVDISTVRYPAVDPRAKESSLEITSTVYREKFQQYWLSTLKCY